MSSDRPLRVGVVGVADGHAVDSIPPVLPVRRLEPTDGIASQVV